MSSTWIAVSSWIHLFNIIAFAAFLGEVQAHANWAGVNFSGDPMLAANQALNASESAGLIPQKFWNPAPGRNGQTGIEIDGGSSIPVYYSGFSALWQSADVGSQGSGSALPNARLMRGSLLSAPETPILVQFAGIPISFTSVGYSLLVYCDAPKNASDIAIKATVQAGAATSSLYMKDSANADFAGAFLRAPFVSVIDRGSQTPAGNVFLFSGLTARDLAVQIEPAESNPNATAAVCAVQLIPATHMPILAPRITSALEAGGRANQPFVYQAVTDVPATAFEAAGLPAGLSIDRTTGAVTGAALQTGEFFVTLTAGNSAGATSEVLRLTFAGADPLSLGIQMVPAVLVRGRIGGAYAIESANELNAPFWEHRATLILQNDAEYWVDLEAAAHVKRFYRASELSQ